MGPGKQLAFRIKICGVTSIEDAQAAAGAGADAIGLNFYPHSPRVVSARQAASIAAEVAGDVCRVGVFVDAPLQTIRDYAAAVGLDAIQLHGDEPPEFVAELRPLTVIRALRLQADDLPRACAYIHACQEAHCLAAVLIDASIPGRYGGTGTLSHWPLVASIKRNCRDIPVVLAGGLTPANVAKAISTAVPDAVDTASGVEVTDGHKDTVAVRDFVREARRAFRGIT